MQANRDIAVWRSRDGRIEARLYDDGRFVGHLVEDTEANDSALEPRTAYLTLPDAGADLDEVILDRSAGLYVVGSITDRNDGARETARYIEWHNGKATTHPQDALAREVLRGRLIPMTTVGGSGNVVENAAPSGVDA